MPSAPPDAVHLLIRGRVQGVGFRYFTQAEAARLQLTGWVRNLRDGAVEAHGEGPRASLEAWIERLRQGPPLSQVEAITPAWRKPEGTFLEFSIR